MEDRLSRSLAAAGIACTAAPAAEQLQLIAPGVRVFGAHVGGLTLEPARTRVETALDRELAIVYRGEVLTVSPQCIRRARERRPRAAHRAQCASHMHASAFASRTRPRPSTGTSPALHTGTTSRRKPAKIVGANANGPIIRDGKVGLVVEQRTLRAAIAQELASGSRRPLVLLMDAVAPKRTASTLGPVIVINRGANTLKLYDASRLVRAFHVATGQSAYPTPTGLSQIVDKQENPWWTPPPSPWAVGAKPIPPGPGNPLGTRWMGLLNAAGVGIHGTPNDASIGYSESHGCIRMHIPEAEWLFQHVGVGTPVVIL